MYEFVKKNGFIQTERLRNVQEICATLNVDAYAMNNAMNNGITKEYIIQNLISRISSSLFSAKLVELEQLKSVDNDEIIFKASIVVSPPGIKYMNVQDEAFIVNNEKFTEEELINAVKIAYPDRII